MNLRKAVIAAQLKKARVTPDFTTVIALRELHDDIVRHNKQTNWILDRQPHTKSVH